MKATGSTKAAAAVSSQLAPRSRFLSRIGFVAMIALSLVGSTLLVGTLGYRHIAHLSWVVSFHQAALLLSGMGPVETQLETPGRIFESIYALFCGVVLLGSTGLLFAPIIHRLLHKFHVEDTGGN
ncbi:MAG: hypothetical protein ABW071_00070 [Casimicrobiaceae bacterium]